MMWHVPMRLFIAFTKGDFVDAAYIYEYGCLSGEFVYVYRASRDI
jgi:hypothetical protein